MEEMKIVRLEDPTQDSGVRSFGVINSEQRVIARLELEFDRGIAHITYLYVDEDVRRQGVGTYLLQSVLNCIDAMDLFTPVEISFPLDEDCEGLYEFIKAQGNMTVDTEDSVWRIPAKGRAGLEEWHKLIDKESDATGYFDLPEKLRTEYMKQLAGEDLDEFDPGSGEDYAKHLCLARVTDGHISGSMFVREYGDDELLIDFLHSGDDDAATLLNLLSGAAGIINRLYRDRDLVFASDNPKIAGIARGIFGDNTVPVPYVKAIWTGLSMEAVSFIDEQMAI